MWCHKKGTKCWHSRIQNKYFFHVKKKCWRKPEKQWLLDWALQGEWNYIEEKERDWKLDFRENYPGMWLVNEHQMGLSWLMLGRKGKGGVQVSRGRQLPSFWARLTRLAFTTQETKTTKTAGPRKKHIQPSLTFRRFHSNNIENEQQEKQDMSSRALAAILKIWFRMSWFYFCS